MLQFLLICLLTQQICQQPKLEGNIECTFYENFRYNLEGELDQSDSSETIILGNYGTYDIKNDRFTALPRYLVYFQNVNPNPVWKVMMSNVVLQNLREESKVKNSSVIFGRIQVGYHYDYVNPTILIGTDYLQISDNLKAEICKQTNIGYMWYLHIDRVTVCDEQYTTAIGDSTGKSLAKLVRINTDMDVIDLLFDVDSDLLTSTISRLPIIVLGDIKYGTFCTENSNWDILFESTFVVKTNDTEVCLVDRDVTTMLIDMEGLSVVITDGRQLEYETTKDGLACLVIDERKTPESDSSEEEEDADNSLLLLVSISLILLGLHVISVLVLIWVTKRGSKQNGMNSTGVNNNLNEFTGVV